MPISKHHASRLSAFTILISLCAAAGPASGVIVAHWRFDEPAGSSVAVDETGGFDGQVVGGAEFGAAGVAGGAVALGFGNPGALDMGNVLAFGDTDFSLALWVKTLPGATNEMYPLAKHASGYGGYLVGINSGNSYGAPGKAWFYDIGSPGQQAFSTTDVNDGQWHQIVCVYQQGGLLGIYVDGLPREGLQLAPLNPVTAARLIVGGLDYSGNVQPYFQGWIDDVQVYDHALKTHQVDYLFAHPSYVYIDEILPVTAGLRLWLRADEAVADGDQQPVAIWADRSGQALHVAQSDPAAQPRFIERALGWNPAVRFDGNDFLIREGVAGSSLMSADAATVYIMARQDGADLYNTVLGWGYGDNRLFVHYTWGGWLIFQHGPPAAAGGAGSWLPPAGWNDAVHLVELKRESGLFSCLIDGVDQGDQGTLGTPNLAAVRSLLIGSDVYRTNDMTGDVFEILVYDRALSPTERAAVRDYFQERYYGMGGVVGVGSAPHLQPALAVAPNPFNPRTVVSFELSQAGEVAVAVHDVQGRLVRRLAAGAYGAGRHELVWDGRDDRGRAAGAGVYLVRLSAPQGGAATRVVLIK
ncbi:MAG: T9SS type A sorting domain-containing protein [bacterium]|nr:T9SS type A sorting domain-containing protein [bacterium]